MPDWDAVDPQMHLFREEARTMKPGDRVLVNLHDGATEEHAHRVETLLARRWPDVDFVVIPAGGMVLRKAEVAADRDVVEEVEASVRAILTDVVADRLVERVVDHVKSHLDEHARIVADRARTAPGLARLVDVNFEPSEGSVTHWAAEHVGATCVRLRPDDVRLIFEADDGDTRMSTTLADFRETGRVTSE